jgi:glyoxylase-like metal-dependent hydrolase (beta-lactamase superfamily II)/putative intracellular protease/amidase
MQKAFCRSNKVNDPLILIGKEWHMKNKKIALLYYDGFSEFEVSLALMYLQINCEVTTIALQKREYKSLESQRFIVDAIINEVDPASLDLLIIPGGEPDLLLQNSQLYEYIKAVVASQGTVAGICGGADLLVGMGFLKGRRCTGNATYPHLHPIIKAAYEKTRFTGEEVVIDTPFITATGDGFIKFAEVLKAMYGIKETILEGKPTWVAPKAGWINVSNSILVSQSAFEECNMTLIASQNEAVLIDTGYRLAEAQRVIDYLLSHNLVLKNIVITHHHEDHDANLALFSMNQGCIYDPSNCAEGVTLKVGKMTVRLFATPGHFPQGDISALVVEENVLIAGDILYSCLPIQLCYGAKPKVIRDTIEKMAKADYAWIIPGHGRIMTGAAITEMALSYIDKLYSRLDQIIDQHGNEDDLYAIKLSDCIAHIDWMVEEPAIDLHRQNKIEIFTAKQKNQSSQI